MIFRQLFEPLSCTYTYLIGCLQTRQAVLIDPVYPTWERDLAELKQLGLTLAFTLETHVHADHITSALKLKEATHCQIGFPAASRCDRADLQVTETTDLKVGQITIEALATPGHTDDHLAYRVGDRVMTGDALLIDGCGRTDFQNGDAATLYRSIHQKLFSLPDDTLIYPGHDYQRRHVSSVIQEKQRNPRLGDGRSLADFVQLMTDLDLDYPKFIDYAVPGNRQGGVCPSDLPEKLQEYCHSMTESPQG